jgi:gliding motility-associated-like protein
MMNNISYQWNTGQTTQNISVDSVGIYSVIVNQDGCADTAFYTVSLFDPVANSPLAENDYVSTPINLPVTFDVLGNDINYGSLNLLLSPFNGSVSLFNNQFTYTPDPNFSGQDSMLYTICNSICVNVCDTGYVSILVQPKPDFAIPQGVSPNNDGYNDYWIISGLQAYPDNKVSILNRWGDVVFEASPYQNNWEGKSNTGLTIGSGLLPRGTYYYVLDLGDGQIFKGFVELTY